MPRRSKHTGIDDEGENSPDPEGSPIIESNVKNGFSHVNNNWKDNDSS